ncbi:hypothetical protein [Foetidibacter luteolus]|uniref:hypothetical protein n=1 Tax=Foetidibacter luteolus TaxID=2608880 RepID=UPI00129A4F54|nr:hypothetical protein [Foetidibacter luteolus]
MKRLFFIAALLAFSSLCGAQSFSDTGQLKTYIRNNIRDKRPDKVTAEQIQVALLGVSNFLNTGTSSQKFVKDTTMTLTGGVVAVDVSLSGASFTPAYTTVEVLSNSTNDPFANNPRKRFNPSTMKQELRFSAGPITVVAYRITAVQ